MQTLIKTLEWLRVASMDELRDRSVLADKLGSAGLFHDERRSPCDPSKSIYGQDCRYMLPVRDDRNGIWQTPLQLADYLILASGLGVKRYLDIGTFSGWTLSIVCAYLQRYDLEHADTYDIYSLVAPELEEYWRSAGIPIVRHVGTGLGFVRSEYDLVFVDGNHETGTMKDFITVKDHARAVAFHDINDAFCPAVRECWAQLRHTYNDVATFHEFCEHPDGFRLMGIGVLVWSRDCEMQTGSS